jgi:hypothetical protein
MLDKTVKEAPVLFTAGVIRNKLHDSFRLLDLLPAAGTKQ